MEKQLKLEIVELYAERMRLYKIFVNRLLKADKDMNEGMITKESHDELWSELIWNYRQDTKHIDKLISNSLTGKAGQKCSYHTQRREARPLNTKVKT